MKTESHQPGTDEAQSFDGFLVEVDVARQRADIVLDRPPLNVVSMAARDQLRAVFERLDFLARPPRHHRDGE